MILDSSFIGSLAEFENLGLARSIDKFSYRSATQGIIVVVEGRAFDKNIGYFRAIRAGTEVYRSWILYAIVLKSLTLFMGFKLFLIEQVKLFLKWNRQKQFNSSQRHHVLQSYFIWQHLSAVSASKWVKWYFLLPQWYFLSSKWYFLLPFIRVENATRNLASYCNFQE